MSDKRFDDLFKQSFGGYSPDVPPHIWENIAAERKKKRPAAFWLSRKAALLLFTAGLLLLSGGAYYIFNKKESGQPVSNNNINNSQEAVNTPVVLPDDNKNDISPTTGNVNDKAAENKKDKVAPDDNRIANTFDKFLGDNSANTSVNRKIKGQQDAAIVKHNKPLTAKTTHTRRTNTNLYNPAIAEASVDGNDTEDEFLGLNTDGFRELIKLNAENKLSRPVLKPFTPAVKISEDCPGAPTNKYYIDAYISPDYAIKKYTDTGVSTLVAKRKESLRFHSAYSVGLRYTRVFNNGMSIRTGFNFSQINEKFSYAQDNVVQIIYVINNQGDTTDSYYIRGTRYKTSYNHYRTIDVPLVIGYEMGNDKLRANINAGAVVNIYSWQNGETIDKDGNPVVITTGKTDNPYQYKTNVGVGFTAGASLYYKLNNRLYAMAEPYFRYNFSPMNKEVLSIQEKFTTIGLRLGIRVDIK